MGARSRRDLGAARPRDLAAMEAAAPPIVHLNVGGTEFSTSHETLTSQCPGSFLHSMFSGDWARQCDARGRVFIDRDGTRFRHVLNFLRSGCLHATDEAFCHELLEEADFFGLATLSAALHQALDAMKEQRVAEDLHRREQHSVLQQLTDGQAQLAAAAAAAAAGHVPGAAAKGAGALAPPAPLQSSSSAPAWMHPLGSIMESGPNSTTVGATPARNGSRPPPSPSPGPQMSPSQFASETF